MSDIEPKGDNVPVFDDIILSFETEPACCLGPGERIAAIDEVLITHHFRLDETPFKILMNGCGGLRGA